MLGSSNPKPTGSGHSLARNERVDKSCIADLKGYLLEILLLFNLHLQQCIEDFQPAVLRWSK